MREREKEIAWLRKCCEQPLNPNRVNEFRAAFAKQVQGVEKNQNERFRHIMQAGSNNPIYVFDKAAMLSGARQGEIETSTDRTS
ncbi:hypothetical protein AJ78_06604 [Emergomyces pasteurianus Ep9510]|uniref:Uncharacterized protein n=1 Tax=Emergomyces pasteurianus Ep9510 TaxID=1447872 RepID=A0A1J9QAB8_9EURO|nr:hypothetical protein AJ78_06604 [Emergomyces pasteurianus Ep9510]